MPNRYEFKEAMRLVGIQNVPREIVPDGEFHRFSPDGKRNTNGWYAFFGNGGAFGDWSRDISEKWSIGIENMSPTEKKKNKLADLKFPILAASHEVLRKFFLRIGLLQ